MVYHVYKKNNKLFMSQMSQCSCKGTSKLSLKATPRVHMRTGSSDKEKPVLSRDVHLCITMRSN